MSGILTDEQVNEGLVYTERPSLLWRDRIRKSHIALRTRVVELEAALKQETLVSARLRESWREDVETERRNAAWEAEEKTKAVEQCDQANQRAEKAEAERDQAMDQRRLKMFVWHSRPSYLAVAYAHSAR